MRGQLRTLVVIVPLLLVAACVNPECSEGNYRRSECRVVAENDVARLRTADARELRFQELIAQDDGTWSALGLIELQDGVVVARPAGLGDFALTIGPGEGADALPLILENVAPETLLTLGPLGEEELLPAATDGLRRHLELPASDEVLWLRGRRPCPSSFRLAALGDIQTNPTQFERILGRLSEERSASSTTQPLLGLLLLGDLTESSSAEEFDRVREIIRQSPIPVAATTGNHDIYNDSTALYNTSFGPGNFATEICGARVVLLDTGNGDLARSIEGRLTELLDPGEADVLIAGTHYPPYADRLGQGWGDEDQAWHLMAEEVRLGADLHLAGHVHYWREYLDVPIGDGEFDEVITGTGGATQGLGEPRFGYTRLQIEDGSVGYCFVETPVPGRVGGPGSASDGIPYCRDP